MTDVRRAMADGDLSFLDDELMTRWTVEQRWFGSKARDVSGVGILEALPLGTESPLLALALVESRFPAGTHELYQVLLGARPASEGWDKGVIGQAGDWTLYDALADAEETAVLGRCLAAGAEVFGSNGVLRFHWREGAEPPSGTVRAMGAEQSNSSIVFDERLVLKVFRRVEPGDNPELEMLRFLQDHGFENIAPLVGWFDFNGELMDATLGVMQGFVGGARDGWELTLEEIADPGLLDRLRDLGAVTGRMHSVLGSNALDPSFAPEDPGEEQLSLLVATIDEQIDRVFLDLPDTDAVEPIRGRGEEIRDRLQLLSHVGVGGKLIRHHGDYHLGQTLLSRDGDWVILDFEGEPARPLLERRRKRSPLRDVAGMLRSFAYAASAARLQHGRPAPDGWEAAAREAFLNGYMEAVEPTLLPAGHSGVEKLLEIFELEKAVYELRYELNNRPDWAQIPVAGIKRLLEEPLE